MNRPPTILPVLLPGRLDPSPGQARRWLAQELGKPAYQAHDSLIARLRDWVSAQLDRLTGGVHLTGPASVALTIVLALAVVALLAWVLPRVRSGRGGRSAATGVLSDPGTSAGQYRDRVNVALTQGRYDEAALDAFRAMSREAIDRAVLDTSLGRTAHETGAGLGRAFPHRSAELRGAADVFDLVRYGGGHVTAAQARGLQDLDLELSAVRPVHPGTASGAPFVATTGRLP